MSSIANEMTIANPVAVNLFKNLSSFLFPGPVPPAIAYCTNLKTLNLQKNCFTGVLPDALFTSCGRLRDLRLWGNSLTGPLSPEV